MIAVGSWIKEKAIKYIKATSSLVAILGGIATLAMFFSGVSKYLWGGISLASWILLALISYFYISKSSAYRTLHKATKALRNIFHRTHNTWHIYKRLSDSLHTGFDVSNIRLRIHKNISNILVNLRVTLEEMHPDSDLYVCVKGIAYKDKIKINKAKGVEYKNVPFVLIDLNFRDPKETHVVDVIDDLDFDPNENGADYNNLQEPLFYKSFISKNIECCDCFSDAQKAYTSKYNCGLVAPVIWHEIPFCFICIGSKSSNVFNGDDEQIVATFTDCIAEFIRLDTIFSAIEKSRKIIVLDEEQIRKMIKEGGDKAEVNVSKEMKDG